MEWVKLINWLEWEIRDTECRMRNLERGIIDDVDIRRAKVHGGNEATQETLLIQFRSKLHFAKRVLRTVKGLAH